MENKTKFKFLDHKADMFIEAYGKSYPEALENVAAGLFETIADSGKLKAVKIIKLAENAPTLEQLTTYLLNQVVSEADAGELMFNKLVVKKFGGKEGNYHVSVAVFGQKAVHKFGRMYVKAVTHHEATVTEKDGGWTIKILPDI
ncbi:MAG: archease [Candidatus Micrarchaeota archaeon]